MGRRRPAFGQSPSKRWSRIWAWVLDGACVDLYGRLHECCVCMPILEIWA